jgi:hypothetical protein
MSINAVRTSNLTHVSHSEAPSFKSRPGNWLFWLKLFAAFLSHSRYIPGYCLRLGEDRFTLHPFSSVLTIQPFWRSVSWTTEGVLKWSKNEQKIYDKYRSSKAEHVTSELKCKTRNSLSLLMSVLFLQMLSCVDGREDLKCDQFYREQTCRHCAQHSQAMGITAGLACSLGQYGDYQIKRLSFNFLY